MVADIGWETNAATKPEMFFSFRTAYEDGLIKVNDPRILKEMRSYTQSDLSNDDTDDDDLEEADEELTRHFDLLTALVITWAMRNFAEVSTEKADDYVQAPYETPGISRTARAISSPNTINKPNDPFAGRMRLGGDIDSESTSQY